MSRLLRVLVILLLPVLVLAGCGKSDTATSSNGDAGQSIPADPSAEAADSAGIDGGCPESNTTSFAKTKFVAHSGLAFGAFHRYLWKPYQAGTFKKGADGRITAFIKGGLAALFIKREIRLASEDVKASPALCKAIGEPLAKIGDGVQSAFDKIKKGDASGLTSIEGLISSVTGLSAANGAQITENEDADLKSAPK